MDIISGIVIATAAFLVAAGLTALFVAWRVGKGAVVGDGKIDWDPHLLERFVESRTRSILITMLVVYFVATTNLLVVAQQVGIAAFNMAAGIIIIVGLYMTGMLWSGSDDHDHWRR